jgi:putative flippase GtrA
MRLSSARPAHHSVYRQFLRFALVGATGTAVQYVVLWAGVRLLSGSAPICSAVGYLCGSVVNYSLNYVFTFASGKRHIEAAAKYYMILAVGFCINIGMMELLVRYLGWNYWLAQILTTGIGLMWNFAGSRWWAFREAREPARVSHPSDK